MSASTLPPTEATIFVLLINRFKGIKGYKEWMFSRIFLWSWKGDFFWDLGRNGSGKSTLLKLFEIYVPEKGTVNYRWKLVSFIELEGFNPELTGREKCLYERCWRLAFQQLKLMPCMMISQIAWCRMNVQRTKSLRTTIRHAGSLAFRLPLRSARYLDFGRGPAEMVFQRR